MFCSDGCVKLAFSASELPAASLFPFGPNFFKEAAHLLARVVATAGENNMAWRGFCHRK